MRLFKRKKETYYAGYTKKQFDKKIKGNVLGVIWKPEHMQDLDNEKVDQIRTSYKKMAFTIKGAFIEMVPAICMYFDYQNNQAEMHMIFTQPVKEDYVEGNGFTEEDFIIGNKENSYLTEEARLQFESHIDEFDFYAE